MEAAAAVGGLFQLQAKCRADPARYFYLQTVVISFVASSRVLKTVLPTIVTLVSAGLVSTILH